MKSISTTRAPAAAGHYSQGIVHNGLVYVSGQLPIVPGSTDHTVGTIEEHTEQVLKNVDAILVAGGSSLQHALQVTIYITDVELWGATQCGVRQNTRRSQTHPRRRAGE